MRSSFLPFFILTLLILGCQSKRLEQGGESYKQICGKYYIRSEAYHIFSGVSFDSNEKILICGAETPGWQDPPTNQAKSFIRNFLRDRGLYNPTFEQKEGKIFIDPGSVSEVEGIKFHNPPPDFFESKFIGIDGKTISSESLDQIKQWTISRLRTLSYPCPEVSVKANPETDQVDVYLSPGKKENINNLERSQLDQLDSRILSRFDAFQIGDPYKDENFILTSRRMIVSGLVDYSDFHNYCGRPERESNHFNHEITFARPRKFIFAIGGTTEEYPILKLSWEHNRVDNKASRFFSELYASSREQSISSEFNWYPFPNTPRLHFIPRVEVARYSERIYEALSQKLGMGLASSVDTFHNRFRWELSPTYNVEKTFRGEGPEHSSFFSLDSYLTLMSHAFEFYQNAPRKGYLVDLNWSTRQRGLGSSIGLNRYLLTAKYLMNWGGFDPPLFVLGFRFQYGLLDISQLDDAPVSSRFFLGGDDNLRGFPRKSLNNQGLGYSSYIYLGTEARFLKVLPFGLQPFLLYDIAKVALENNTFIEPILTSAGAGMRWQSPFGSFRATLAYGMIDNHDQYALGPTNQWKAFFSFGKEF